MTHEYDGRWIKAQVGMPRAIAYCTPIDPPGTMICNGVTISPGETKIISGYKITNDNGWLKAKEMIDLKAEYRKEIEEGNRQTFDDVTTEIIELKRSYGMPIENHWQKVASGMPTSEMDPEVVRLLEEKIKHAEEVMGKNLWALSQPNWVEHYIPPLTRWQRFKQRIRNMLRLRKVKVYEQQL